MTADGAKRGGGATVLIAALARGAEGDGIERRIVEAAPSCRAAERVIVVSLDDGGSVRFLASFIRSLYRDRPAVVLLTHARLLPLAIIARWTCPGAATALLAEGVRAWREGRRFRRWIGLRAIRGHIDMVLCAGPFAARLTRRAWGLAESAVRVLPDPDERREARSDDRQAPVRQPHLILSIKGRGPPSGVGQVITAVARLSKTVPDISCEILHEGRIDPELAAFARAIGVADRVRFRDRLAGAKRVDAYRRAGVLVLPAEWGGGSGRAVLEAWQHGLPVICGHDEAAAEGTQDGFAGLAIDLDDPDALAAAIERVITQPDIAQRLAAAGSRALRQGHVPTTYERAVGEALDALIAKAREFAAAPGVRRPVMPAAPRPVSRILVYRLGSIGDMVVSLPSLHAIRRKFPHAKIALLTNQPSEQRAAPAGSVLEGTGLVDQFISYPLRMRRLLELHGVWRSVRAFGPDLLIYLAAPRGTLVLYRDYLFFRLCGITKSAGFPFRADLQVSRPPERGGVLWESEAHRLARCLAEVAPAETERRENWDLHLSSSEIAHADRLIRDALSSARAGLGLLGVCVGTKQPIKDWGEENWRSVLRALRDPRRALVMIGAEDEFARSQAVAEGWPAPVLNFCGRLSPRMSAAVIRRVELFLCHDSGPMHLAAALGVPCVAVFSRQALPGEWFPVGGNHTVFYPPNPGDTIQAIRPRQVIEAALKALPETVRSPSLPSLSS